MKNSLVLISISAAFILTGCEKKTTKQQSAPTAEKAAAPAKAAAPVKAAAPSKSAAEPAAAKPGSARPVDEKRSPECLAALDAVKSVKAQKDAKPDAVKAAITKAMQACAKAHPNKPQVTVKGQKEVKPAVPEGQAPKGLEGRWTIDPEAIAQLEEFKKLPEQQRAMTLMMFKNLKMEITFGASQIATNGEMMGQKRAEMTNFKILKRDGNTLKIESRKDENEKPKTQTITLDGDKMQIKDDAKGQTLTLKRIK
ncbi:MAG: hypothetical protein ACON3Z_07765 [Bradymonadia bacterium]